MKLSDLLLSLLTLILISDSMHIAAHICSETLATELTNNTDEDALTNNIQEVVANTVQEAVASLENRLETQVTNTMEQLLKLTQQQLDNRLPAPPQLGSKDKPAISCRDLHERLPQTPSDYYWIRLSQSPGNMSAVNVYCGAISVCGIETRGWMRVANIDMKNVNHSCPSGLRLISSPIRLCDITTLGCVSKMFNVHGLQYSRVSGKIIAHHNELPVAFNYGSSGIDRDYVHGVSLTYGQYPRRHIWTFAGAADENPYKHNYKCPCINTAFMSSSRIPSFVGTDYFCDTALEGIRFEEYGVLTTSDPLWDGQGCGRNNTCCSLNNPPIFVKDLPSPTSDNIEMRLCRPVPSGSTPIEVIELYVQ